MAHVSNGSVFVFLQQFIQYWINYWRKTNTNPKHGAVRNVGHYPNWISLQKIVIGGLLIFVNLTHFTAFLEKQYWIKCVGNHEIQLFSSWYCHKNKYKQTYFIKSAFSQCLNNNLINNTYLNNKIVKKKCV